MSATINHQTMSLAGVFQAASLVDQLAKRGQIEPSDLENAIKSILNLNPTSVEDVFNGVENLRLGLTTLQASLNNNGQGVTREVLQYAMSIIAVQIKLEKRSDLMDVLSRELDHAFEQQRYFNSYSHESVISSAARCYENSVSKLSFRIKITGNPTYLQNPNTAEKVRALLLFGVRSALLWRHQGGRRWHLMTKRGKLKQTATDLLNMA